MKRLEELVNDSLVLLKKKEEENESLRLQVEALSADRRKAAKNAAGTRELDEFKARVKKRLARLAARIDKAVTMQDTLFPEDPDGV